jgi:VanZ family protein
MHRSTVGPAYARLLFWGAALFALVMATLPHPPDLPGHPSDKIQHIIAFATLGALGAWAYPRTRLVRIAIGLSMFGATIELMQAIPSLHRDSDVLDWLADTAASALVLLLVRWRRRWRPCSR